MITIKHLVSIGRKTTATGAIATMLLVAALPVTGQTTYTWTDGGGGNNWSGSNNWTGASGVPDANDHFVIFPQRGGNDTVDLNDGDWTVGGITFTHTSNTYTIKSTQGSGAIQGNLRNHGDLTNNSGGTVIFEDFTRYYQSRDGTWNLHSDPSKTIFNGEWFNAGTSHVVTITLNGGLTLNNNFSYSGTFAVNSGVIRLGDPNNLNAAAGDALSSADVVLNTDNGIDVTTNSIDATVERLSGTGNMDIGATTFTVRKGGTTYAGDLTGTGGTLILGADGSGGGLTLTGDISGLSTLRSTDAAIVLDGSIVNLNSQGSDGLVLNGGNITINGADVTVNNNGRVAVGSNTLTINAGTLTAGWLTQSTDGTVDLTDPTGGVALTLGLAGGTSYDTNYNGVITGTGTLHKVGTGSVTLLRPGASFTGNLIIDNGQVLIGHRNALQQATVAINTNDGLDLNGKENPTFGAIAGTGNLDIGSATVNVGGNDASTTYAGQLTGTGIFAKTGTGDLTLSAANPFAGNTQINNGSVILANADALANSAVAINTNNGLSLNGLDANLGALAGNSNGSLNLGTQTVTVGSNNASTTYSGGLSGAGQLNKVGTGTLTLAGTYNNLGKLDHRGGGEVELTGSGSINEVLSIGGTLDIRGAADLDINGSIFNALFLNSSSAGFIREAAQVELTDTAANTRVILINSATLNISDANTSLIAPRIAVGLSGGPATSVFTAEQFATVQADRLDIGDLGNNDNSAGSFIIQSNAQVTADSVILHERGTLEINNGQLFANTIVDFGTTPQAINLTSSAGKEALVIGSNGGNSTIHNILQDAALGPGAIRKEGAGTLELTAANTYSRGTDITGGTLLVNNTIGSATGSGIVLVRDTATLGGDGSIAGRVFVYDGGTVAPGNSPGTLAVGGDFDLSTGSTLKMELAGLIPGTEYDTLDVAGSVDLAGTLDLTYLDGFTASIGDSFLIIDTAGGVNGMFDTLLTPDSQDWQVSYGANTVTIEVVPEPGSLGMLSLLGLLSQRRRRTA